jgi:sugar phosphate isomerase/epimerase
MLAIYQYFGYNIPLKERFKMIKSVGFDAVGLWRDDWYEWSGHRSFADMARNEGLLTNDGHAPFDRDYAFVNALWTDSLAGETTLDIYRQTITACAEDGVKNLIVHIEDRGAPPPNELGIQRLKKLVDIAEKCGVNLALENINHSSYLTYVYERISSPNLGFCYDAGHRNCKEPNSDILKMFGDRLIAVHLHDNDGSGDQHRIPFEKSINWQEQMGKIAAAGYLGATTLECTIKNDLGETRSAEEYLSDAYKAAKRLDDMRRI